MTTLIDDCFGQVSRDIKVGASGPEAFILLLRRLMTHLNQVDTGRATSRFFQARVVRRMHQYGPGTS